MNLFEILKQLWPLLAFFVFCVVFLFSCNHVINKPNKLTFDGQSLEFNGDELTFKKKK
jgi:hypothetical protein